MSDPLRQWVRDLLIWVRDEAGDVELAAEALLRELGKGVKPTTPPDTGTTLLSAIERRFTRWR